MRRGWSAVRGSSARRRRIQAWSLREGVLHRWFHRRSLRVDTAAGQRGGQDQHTLKDIAPIATPGHCDALINLFLPEAGWGALDWQPLSARLARANSAFVLGRGPGFAIACEAALKFKETSGIHAEA